MAKRNRKGILRKPLFEYDEGKSRSNERKHGINFEEAQSLGDDPEIFEYPLPFSGEDRYLAVGLIDEKHWSAVATIRGKNIRIISVRRSREDEIASYEIDKHERKQIKTNQSKNLC